MELYTIIQLTDNNANSLLPLIDGNNIVWQSGEDSESEIFLYNGTETIQLTNNDVEERFVQIDGNNVVWQKEEGEEREIFFYNGVQTIQLTNNDIFDGFPQIDKDNIVWQRQTFSDTGEEIFNIVLATPNPQTVYRFLNNDTGVHFYTANPTERDAVQELSNFSFEGASYIGVDPLTGISEPSPVYRFLNQDKGVHLYTVSEVERDAVQNLDNFSFEGEVFSAYTTEVEGTIPIYRFFNATTGAHFYTPSEVERDAVLANLPDFQSEGIAYYAFPSEI